jgi:hypothetical protein
MKRKHEQEFEKNKKGGGYYKESFVQDPWKTEIQENNQSKKLLEKEKMYYKESFIKDPWNNI